MKNIIIWSKEYLNPYNWEKVRIKVTDIKNTTIYRVISFHPQNNSSIKLLIFKTEIIIFIRLFKDLR